MMEKIGLYLTSTWAVVISASLLLILYVSNPSPIQILQLKTFDYLITSLEQKQSDEIVIVNFGEKSVEKFGQWPFDRRDIAKTIDILRKNNAGPIVMPILFSEKDRANGDSSFETTLKDGGVIIAQTPTSQNKLPDAVRRGFAAIGSDPTNWLFGWRGAIAPLPAFASNAEGVGLLATIPEPDGVVRRLPMLARIGTDLYPSLVLETLRVAAGDPSYQIKTGDAGIEAVRIPQFPAISTDERARIWLSWNNRFDTIEATEIDERVKDKIVVLGITIEGIGGIIATPIGERWAHEIQAQALQTLIDGTSISRLSYAKIIEYILLMLLLVLFVYIVPKLSVKLTVPFYLFFLSSITYGSYYLFSNYLQLWDVSYIIIACSIVFGHLIFNNFAREFRLKQQIKKQFGTYLSPALVEKLQKNPELLRLGGETRELSIMFTDVRGFTTISEHYGSDVQGLTQIMNRYMTAMTSKIIQNDGTLDKYIGDAQMAFWNAPLDDEWHARHAVKTALEMLDDLKRFNSEIVAEGVPPFGMGLGINTGSVVVGNMGSSQRFDYTCLGDTVNLASRLEGQSKPYHVKMVIGPKTYEYVKDEYLCLELDCLAVKGKSEGVNIYTIVDKDFKNVEKSKDHKHFINHYRNMNWVVAQDYIKTLKNYFKGDMDEYYDMMNERIEEYKINPPGGYYDGDYIWDGVFRTNSK
jgi:adenylate cyclase